MKSFSPPLGEVTVTGTGVPAVPEPLRVTRCALPGALLVMSSAPLRLPWPCGANVTLMPQLPPGVRMAAVHVSAVLRNWPA